MYRRNYYLDLIRPFVDKPLIKVITGMRRVGKSYFLRQLIDEFKASGIPESNIHFIDKESLDFDFIKTYTDLNDSVLQALSGASGPKYLFVDEVQEIREWEKAITSLAKREDVDIYITGSNAHLFSRELATLLSGRYVEFQIYPLSFNEFLQFRDEKQQGVEKEFENYVRFGGLPAIHHLDLNDETVFQYIESIYYTILLKDIVRRHEIRNVPLLENITAFLFANVGNLVTAKRITDYLKSQKISVGVETVQNYLSYFLHPFTAYKVSRFDIKGKRLLEINDKYYLGDVGLRHSILGFRESDISGILENIVFLELKRRGYKVTIGKFDTREVDFIAQKENEKMYVQVCYLLGSDETIRREFEPLAEIQDNYPKTVLSMDRVFGRDLEGIQRMNIIDFLLNKTGISSP